jgi:hypothetical protein
MKKHLLMIVLLSAVSNAEEFPLRDPAEGESRPAWWYTCWASHIVVIEGKISFEDDGNPDVEVRMSDESAKKELSAEKRELQRTLSKFYIGKIVPKKVLFVSPGITSEDGSFEPPGELKSLIPLWDKHGILRPEATNGKEAVYIFRYGSQMLDFPLILSSELTQADLGEAKKIFEHRTKFDYRNQKAEQAVPPNGP